MSKHWICNSKCYVPIDGRWVLKKSGDKVAGDIDATIQKHFDLVNEQVPQKDEIVAESQLTRKEMKRILDKKGIKYFKGASIEKLKELLANADIG